MLCLDGGVIIRSLIPCKGKLFFTIFFSLALYQAAEHGPRWILSLHLFRRRNQSLRNSFTTNWGRFC